MTDFVTAAYIYKRPGISFYSVMDDIKSGKLSATREGFGKWRIKKDDATKYLAERYKAKEYASRVVYKTRDAAIVRAYEGGATLRAIGAQFGISGERVRHIIIIAERKLQHPSRAGRYKTASEMLNAELGADVRKIPLPLLDAPREWLKEKATVLCDYLSVRTANCVKNFGDILVEDLIRKTEADMLATPDFGRVSLEELKTLLSHVGLHLARPAKPRSQKTLMECIQNEYRKNNKVIALKDTFGADGEEATVGNFCNIFDAIPPEHYFTWLPSQTIDCLENEERDYDEVEPEVVVAAARLAVSDMLKNSYITIGAIYDEDNKKAVDLRLELQMKQFAIILDLGSLVDEMKSLANMHDYAENIVAAVEALARELRAKREERS